MILVQACNVKGVSGALRQPSGQNFAMAYPAHVDATDTESGGPVGDSIVQIVQTDDVNDVSPIRGQVEVVSWHNGSCAPSMTSFQFLPHKRYIEHTRG